MHGFGPNEFVIEHVGIASVAEDVIADFYIGSVYSGAIIEIVSEGIVSNRCGTALKSVIGIVRQGGANVADSSVSLIHRTYTGAGVPAAHTMTPDGNNQRLKLTFDAGATGSGFRHHVLVRGVKTLVKKY